VEVVSFSSLRREALTLAVVLMPQEDESEKVTVISNGVMAVEVVPRGQIWDCFKRQIQ
jgi:hypothetical protein